jgi:hypothetical protein
MSDYAGLCARLRCISRATVSMDADRIDAAEAIEQQAREIRDLRSLLAEVWSEVKDDEWIDLPLEGRMIAALNADSSGEIVAP